MEDVRYALLSATTAKWRAHDQTWKISGGTDLDGQPLAIGISFEGNTVWICMVY